MGELTISPSLVQCWNILGLTSLMFESHVPRWIFYGFVHGNEATAGFVMRNDVEALVGADSVPVINM